MGYLFDTNIFIHLQRNRDEHLAERIQNVVVGSGISSISVMEMYYGVARSRQPENNLIMTRSLLSIISTLEYSEADAYETGMLRAELAREGTPIGPFDVCIAGQARARKLTLVTANIREFERVPGLRVENWLRS
ncbi:tRNA(fMet)-specific endonuclease VapC [Aurantimicrobium minutum]|uniref:type II toxin-antitoxin system VapC family toxin n=1 Tax=Aurantimicrobium minutum TaxID=708131 RepID=UPI0024744AC8|nr:type II toxin-antitoxin system VapC family toxin [Aurantimicrobium minutum]MDH6532500.1 tRNA(fMet)-specific endonuclease VapC [Aurantimicrobium minutum]